MKPVKEVLTDQRGMALVMALIVLSAISLITIAMLMSVATERKLSGHQLRESSALDFAEAGVAEAMSRIAIGDVNFGSNPRGTALIFSAPSGSLPTVGADTTALATAQPAGAWLRYSSATKGPDALTVKYKTDGGRTAIYRYDNTKNPPVNLLTGMPVYSIRSTGKRGQESRTVVTEVTQIPINLNIKGAVAADVEVKFIGTAQVCGYNHRADTPVNVGEDGRTGGGNICKVNATQWETNTGDLCGIWSSGTIQASGGAATAGTPSALANQAGFYNGPWDALGMTQPQFWAWVGASRSTMPADLNGIYYLDNNSTTQDRTGSFAIGGASGSGFLYVDGDLTLNSDCEYRGMIYVEGDLNYNGNAWVLGSIICKGRTQLKNNGQATMLYSSDAIQQAIAKFKGAFLTLGWREL